MKNTVEMQGAMKAQAFGVEVEMNGIKRRDAARIAARFFGTNKYRNTEGVNGYRTWSAFDALGREWKFSRDVSINGPDAEKCEMVTPPLHYEDLPALMQLIDLIESEGAVSTPDQGCGIHIHVDGTGHTPETLRNLVNMMASHEDLLINSINVDGYRINRYCKVVDTEFLEDVNKIKPSTLEGLEDLWYETQGRYGRDQHYNESRYHMLNLHSFFHGHGTVEFRLFQFDNPGEGKKGGLNSEQLKAYVDLALAMNAAAKMQKSCRYQKGQRENEKFAMRTWLMRLGFIGKEFKSSMMYLTKRLEGNAAWR